MTTANRRIVAPRTHPETTPYWEAAAEGRLLVKRCAACAAIHYYPRAICPYCLSDKTEWIAATGKGQLYSYSSMGKGETAYTLAYVTLDEGITMLTNIVDCDVASLRVGQRVTVVFKPSDGGPPVPMFTPA